MTTDHTDDGSTDPTDEGNDDIADERLLQAFRVVARAVDPVPAESMAAAISSFTWRTIDAELAELTFDSAAQEDALAGVRGGDSRLLSFEAPGLVVDIEVTDAATGAVRAFDLVGQAAPAVSNLELRRIDGNVAVAVDDLGRFRVSSVPAGPLSMRCELPAVGAEPPRAVSTDWVTV